MPRLALTGGSYQARSVIASAQRSLNLMPELMPQQQGEPAAYAHYPTPGLRLLGTMPQGPIRGIRQATSGELYVVAGSGVYLVNTSTWTGTLLGNITAALTTPVSMQDNTLTMVIVDGSTSGWTVDLSSHAFAAIDTAITSTPFANTGTFATTLGDAYYTPFTPSVEGTIGTISVYTLAFTVHCKMAIYDGGNVIGTSNVVTNPGTGTTTFTFSPPVSVSNTRVYNVAICQDATVSYGVTTGSTAGFYSTTPYASFPASNPTLVSGSQPIAITVTLTPNPFAGADRVDYIDTYLVFNKPGTPQFYSSNSLAVTFDSLFFANKSSYTDKLVTLAVAKREIWLLGERTTEIWYDLAGGSTTDISAGFPFSEIPSTFIDHGCAAKYSVATYDNSVFWLTADRGGTGFVMQGAGYQNKRISTFALEQAWADYPTISDAIGMIYLLGGHIVYVLTFPTADHTWCYDVNTSLWHEWLWVDSSGNEHRHRAMCCYNVNGTVVMGDWQSGNLYALDHNIFTDNGQPIKRQRSYPHILNDGKRMYYREFIADIETGMGGPASLSSTLIECLFNAPDGTPVEAYSPSPVEANATWSRQTGVGAEILGNAAVALAGPTIYASNAPLPYSQADYSISFRVLPQPLATDGSSALVLGRVTNIAPLTGYIGGIQITGGVWYAQLGGAEQPLGAPPVNGWFDCTMSMVGSLITLRVQRSSDGLYLGSDGQWHPQLTMAIAVTDSTYTASGRVMFGLNAIPTGIMGTEDATGTWLLEDGSASSWEWAEVATESLGIDNIVVQTVMTPWQLLLDWSNDRGHTFGTPVPQSIGGNGEYLTSVQWQRLEYSRDRVFRLTWTAPLRTALQGAFVEAQPALT